MRQKTIVDIAKKLKLSPSTISRALNDHPDINSNTKILVNKIAKEIGYIPNPIARSLRKNKTNTIGIIVPEIKHDFFSSAISGIEEIAYQNGFSILLCQSNESYEREIVNTQVLVQHRIAGLIVSISQTTKKGNHFNELLQHGIPLVFFDRVCKDVNAYKVIIDDEKSAFNAVTYLINKGYKKIAHLAGPAELDICTKRYNGYVQALKSHNIRLNKNLVMGGGLHENDGYESMNKLLMNNKNVDAVFAVNDPVAIGAYQKIKEAGLRIPDDIGIIGFSNNKITSLIEPKMTTVDQPSFDMGKKAAEILIDLIKNEDKISTPRTEILETKLIIREST